MEIRENLRNSKKKTHSNIGAVSFIATVAYFKYSIMIYFFVPKFNGSFIFALIYLDRVYSPKFSGCLIFSLQLIFQEL